MYSIYGKEVGEPVLITPEEIQALLAAKEGKIDQKKNSKPGLFLTEAARDFIRSIAVSQRCADSYLDALVRSA